MEHRITRPLIGINGQQIGTITRTVDIETTNADLNHVADRILDMIAAQLYVERNGHRFPLSCEDAEIVMDKIELRLDEILANATELAK